MPLPIPCQLVARTAAGEPSEDVILRVYDVSFTTMGVPVRGNLTNKLFYPTGWPATQGHQTTTVLSDNKGVLRFMLMAGVYWVELTRGPDLFEIREYPVGRAQRFDVGTDEDEVPTGNDLLVAFLDEPPAAGDDGRLLSYDHGLGRAVLVDPPAGGGGGGSPYPFEIVTGTSGDPYVLPEKDRDTFIEQTGATDAYVELETNMFSDLEIGSMFQFTRIGPGELFIRSVSGVTINGEDASEWRITAPYGGATLYKRGTDEWVLQGQIEEVE